MKAEQVIDIHEIAKIFVIQREELYNLKKGSIKYVEEEPQSKEAKNEEKEKEETTKSFSIRVSEKESSKIIENIKVPEIPSSKKEKENGDHSNGREKEKSEIKAEEIPI